MHWTDEQEEDAVATPESVIDLSFSIDCKTLPVDHAYGLFVAIAGFLPWLEREPQAGIHPLHVAESAHGWLRPQAPDALLHLSRRTRLVLRLPLQRAGEARVLQGQQVMVDGHAMTIGEAVVFPLSRSKALFSRRVVMMEGEAEEVFQTRMLREMHSMGVRPKKLLPGLAHTLRIPEGELCTRLLSVEGLTLEESFRLQMEGLGPCRHLGCGIFIPHKPLSAVRI